MRASDLFEGQVANADTVDEYCKIAASNVTDPARRAWMYKAARRYIYNSGPLDQRLIHYTTKEYLRHAAEVDVLVSDEMKPYLQNIVDQGLPFGLFITADQADDPGIEDAADQLAREMTDVVNWLNEVPAESYRNMDFDTALRFAEAHAKKMALRPNREDVLPVLKVGDMTWVQLTSRDAVTGEGRLMQNCLKDQPRYGWNVENGDATVYSLRDRNGHPHVTVYVSGDFVEQAKGKQNNIPKPIYQKAANALFAHLDLEVEPWETQEWEHDPRKSLKEAVNDREGRCWINHEGLVISVDDDNKEHDCVAWDHGMHGVEDAEYHGWIRINTSEARSEFNIEWRRGRVSKAAMRTAMKELKSGGYTTVIVDEDCSTSDRMLSQRFTDVNAAVRYCISATELRSLKESDDRKHWKFWINVKTGQWLDCRDGGEFNDHTGYALAHQEQFGHDLKGMLPDEEVERILAGKSYRAGSAYSVFDTVCPDGWVRVYYGTRLRTLALQGQDIRQLAKAIRIFAKRFPNLRRVDLETLVKFPQRYADGRRYPTSYRTLEHTADIEHFIQKGVVPSF